LAHERSLAKRLEGKPFVILGICTPFDPDALRQLIDDGEVTWRVWDDKHGSIRDGVQEKRLAPEWRVEYRPRTYVLDHKGVIRHKGLRDEELDRAVDQLLQELENEKGS
jgi:peroxiredoxin